MKWMIGFFLLLLQSGFLLGQGQSSFTLKGRVVDEQTGEPLVYATVALVKFPMTEVILKGVVTDEEGKFELKGSGEGYRLIIRNLGYRNYFSELSEEKSAVMELGTIRLTQQPELLGMVTVKPLVEVSVDEITYDLSADPDRETSSLHGILDKVPMIHRSPMGDLYVNDPNKKFLVVRNGRADALFSGNLNDILKALPAKGFAKVTVMLAPPGRYGEYDYVISVETDKSARLHGAVGNLMGEERVGDGVLDVNGGVTTSLDKLRFSLNGLFQNTNVPLSKQFIEKQVVGESQVSWQEQRNNTSGEAWGVGSVFSYDLSEQHFLTWRISRREGNERNRSRLESGDEEKIATDFVKRKKSGNWNGGISYQYDIGTTKRVLNVAYSFQLSPVDRRDIGDNMLQPVDKEAKERQQEQAFQLHYFHPLSRYWKMETGAGYLYRDYFSADRDGSSRDDLVPGVFSMESQKHIVNAYFRLDYNRKKMSVGVELKADYLNDGRGTEIVRPEVREAISETGFNFMPIVRLGWLFPNCKFSRLNLDYRLTHYRPYFSMLSTYEDVSNGDFVRVGNPDLRPQKQHVLNLSTSYRDLYLFGTWSYSGDQIGRYWYLDDSGRTISTYGNYGYMSSYSLSSGYSYNRKGLNLQVMLGGSYMHGEMLQQEKQETWSINSSCSAGYVFKNQLNLGLGLGYNDSFGSGYSVIHRPAWTLAVWGKKMFFKDKVELEVYYSDLTRFTRNSGYQVNATDFNMTQRTEQTTVPLSIKLSWRIGSFKLKPVRNIRRGVVVDDILKE